MNQNFAIILHGLPGSGKGTQRDLLKAEMPNPVAIYATGDLIREHLRLGTSIAHAAVDANKKGHLVDDGTVYEMLVMKHSTHCYNEGSQHPQVSIWDGFPRNLSQWNTYWPRLISRVYSEPPKVLVVNLIVPEEVAKARLAHRTTCKNDHIFKKLPAGIKCPQCGQILEYRPDFDCAEERMQVFWEETAPLERAYIESNIPYLCIDGTGKEEDVHGIVMRSLYNAGLPVIKKK